MALIYQLNIVTSTEPSAEIILRQRSHVIHEKLASRQSQRKNDQALINVVAANNGHLFITPLYILSLEASSLEFTTLRKHNPAKKRKFSNVEIETLMSQVQLNQLVLFGNLKIPY